MSWQLAAAVEQVAAEDIDPLSTPALGEHLVELRGQIDRLEAEFSRRLRRFDAGRGWSADGSASAVAWLRAHCRLSSGDAAQRVEVAQRLSDLPGAEDALRSGAIGFRHAAVLARTVAEVGPEAAAQAAEALVDAARRLDPDQLRLVSRHLRHCIDPDGALAAAIHDHQRRWLQLSQTFDGVYALDGLLDPEGGAALRTALDALSHPVPGDARTAAQRRADALVELALRQLQGGSLPSVAGQRPHLVVHVSEAALRGQPGAAAAELDHSGPIPPATLQRLACDAAITEVASDPAGAVVASRAQRTIPPSIRRALVARDRRCRFPGCDRPPDWTDGHHIRHRAQGGPTEIDNLVLLCRVHHRLVHEGGWRLVGAPTGVLEAVPP